MVEISSLFPRTFFVVISLVEKSTLFPRTFFDVISLVEKSTLFPLTFPRILGNVKMIESVNSSMKSLFVLAQNAFTFHTEVFHEY